jgi:hypothetical protein
MPCRDVRAGTHIEKVNAEPSAKWLLNEAAMKRPRCVSSRSTVSWWGSHPNRASGCSPKKVDLCVLSWVVVVVVVVEEKEWARAERGEGTVVAAATATARRDTWDTCGLNRSISIDGRAAWFAHQSCVLVSCFALTRRGGKVAAVVLNHESHAGSNLITTRMHRSLLLVFLTSLLLPRPSAAATVEEPGENFIGATYSETFEGLGLLTAEIVDFTPPSSTPSTDLREVETRGLYKVLYSDGDHAQLYYKDLIKRGAALPAGKEL